MVTYREELKPLSETDKHMAWIMTLGSAIPSVILLIVLFWIGFPSEKGLWAPNGGRAFCLAFACAAFFFTGGLTLVGWGLLLQDSTAREAIEKRRSTVHNPMYLTLQHGGMIGVIAGVVFAIRYVYLLNRLSEG